ncbi:FxDxF family PEP-CTERM protein [Pseudoduganella sp. OTU4001]|uniref:FxDxF family PEP-CTERM protein n=1 Tax=Pseudoduganella sp. OTU4001 TaxID=3043854 RepID=UPI00313D2C6E
MDMRTCLAAAALLAAAGAARADDLASNVNLGGSASHQSAAFGVTHRFTDTFSFSPSAGSFLVDASLVTIGFTPAADVSFLSAMVNGHAMTLTAPGVFEYGFLAPTTILGPLVLTVKGYVDTPGSVGPASASYGGTLSVSAVPEPALASPLLAGLVVAAAAGLVNYRHADPKV